MASPIFPVLPDPSSPDRLPLLDYLDASRRPRHVAKMNRAMAARHNRELVLHLISSRGAIAPSAIASLTHLQRSTVHYVLRDLREEGFIREGEALEAKRTGPKERPVAICPGIAWSAGLSLSAEGHRLCVIDAAGTVLAQQAFPPAASLTEFLDELPTHLRATARKHTLRSEAHVGLAVCLPGVVDHRTGRVLNSQSLALKDFPLEEQLRRRLGAKVMVERIAACGAYAEKYLGGQGDMENFLYLLLRPETSPTPGFQGYSFGLAIVIGGKIYRGANSAAAELNAVFLPAGIRPEVRVTPDAVRPGKALDAFLTAIGGGVAKLVNLLDPSVFVLAGESRMWTDENLQAVRDAALAALTPVSGRQLAIVRSPLGLDGVTRGAALLCLHRGLIDRLGRDDD